MKKFVYILFCIVCFLTLSLVTNTSVFLNAQSGWGPDIQVTSLRVAVEPEISASCGVLHVIWWELGIDSLGPYEDVFYSQSTDSGAHWTDTIRLSPRDNESDVLPVIVADSNDVHTAWWILGGGGVSHRRSTDGGFTWGDVDTVIIQNGHHPSIDKKGDTLYIVAAAGGRTKFRRSTDQGLTWLPVQDLGRGTQLSDLLVEEGSVHVIIEADSIHRDVYYTRSTDGGSNWAPMVRLSEYDNHASQRPKMSGDGLYVYVVWVDYKYSPYATGDVFLRRSTNGGETWVPEETLTVDHRAWASDIIAQNDTVHVVWEDERVDPGSNLEIYYRMSTDRGLTWGSETRLTFAPEHSYNPILSQSAELLHMVWWDERNDTTGAGYCDVYYKEKRLFTGGVRQSVYVGCSKQGVEIAPNPIRSTCQIRVKEVLVERLVVYDALGKKVKTIMINGRSQADWDLKDDEGKEVRSGVYFLKVASAKLNITKKIVVIR